ncbi:MAG: Glycosyl transferase group 1 [Candidatus Collierbacteria bacterium GW2011_GWB1_44_6]|uniref:Glycosyl transferase group 1 n=2 Tax=Candidatus Collieribacteriota TaxID=1752725 RepID=A0A0G1MP05_9BACT|nr:MAG: Glycosyl transferase group 1 [Candidatus Collierbacteria bacterium GW2011_GWC2_43_12]KKT73739.1 MAG: Glycosyl transferase group 1 [Candidatus Collierbacteria bacterium GW2011_GWB1_44_6]KKT83386.1 MAG: Glycosyl transferase group 1 [Microgenomates group bacterium GW2011_GWC1_44_9]
MKIAIDISQAIYGTGVSVYTKNLVSNLIKLHPEDEFILFGGSLRRRRELLVLAKKFKGTPKIFPFPPTMMDFIWNSLHLVPVETFTGPVDIIHTSDWTEPPSRYPKVTTVHDLVPFKYPHTTTDSIRNAHKKRLAWVMRESKKIIAVSESTRSDLISILRIPEEKIVVIPEGVEERYTPQPLEIVETVTRKYKTGDEYIFTLSTLEPRKNQPALIKAFDLVREKYPNLKLLIGGRVRQDSEVHSAENILTPGYIPDADLPALYSGCLAFVLPSLYEGFGLSPLQAMACGAPVAVSDISSLPEVVGDAGVLFDPSSLQSIAAGIIEAIQNRSELRKKSLKQAAKFTWKHTAEETYKTYNEVLGLTAGKNNL